MYDILELSKKLLPELREIAKELKIKKAESLKKQDLVYKILDQQAIEATEAKKEEKKETNLARPPIERHSMDRDFRERRGKRPRTLKPIQNRKVESVITVKPSDLIKDNPPSDEKFEPVNTQERTDEKPDLFRHAEPVIEDVQKPEWKQDQISEESKEKQIFFERTTEENSEKNVPESVPEPLQDSN